MGRARDTYGGRQKLDSKRENREKWEIKRLRHKGTEGQKGRRILTR